jgi:hypothetical protein
MNNNPLFQGKKCVSCGQFFEANPRVGERQKSCGATACRKKRKRMQERAWKARNPDYGQGFYASYVKPWRQKHPEYQKQLRCKKRREIKTQIPPETPMKSIRLHLRCKWRLGEIKTQFLRVTQTAQGFWVDGGEMQAA